MAYASREGDMDADFPFSNLHSFKDFVVFVQTYLPDRFRPREGVGAEDQWTMELAFEGLRKGLRMAAEEKGQRDEFTRGESLVEEAYAAYRDRRVRDGFFKLDELQTLLKRLPSC
jgi:hypothetical protein